MSKNSFSKTPPTIKNSVDPEELRSFIEGAEYGTKNPPTAGEGEFPWQDLTVRSDVHKIFNLRLPESYFIKLSYLAHKTKSSKQKICLDAVKAEIDKMLKN